jgi:hypothetical protein
MTEPDVTLTDCSLAILCSWFAWNLWKQRTDFRHFQTLWMIFFASIATASLTGGTVHGFFLDESTFGYRLLWPATLLTIGILPRLFSAYGCTVDSGGPWLYPNPL